MIDDGNIVMLRHHYKNLPVIDVTSRNRDCGFARQVSPMFIAPDDLGILEKRHPEEKIGAKSRDWHGGSAGVPSAM